MRSRKAKRSDSRFYVTVQEEKEELIGNMETTKQNRILEEEKISKLLLKFSVPCVMGLLISALYNIVDQIFIGNSELGYLGNAATGVSFPVICIANAFAWCVGDGAASFLSICAGRKDTERAHKCVGTGITVTFLISVVLMLLCEAAAAPLMRLFGASEQTLDLAVTYFRIIAAFFPFYLLLNVMNSIIRADGSPAFAMTATMTGAIANIILDPIFIFVLKWGIAGAAWATAIGQTASFLLCAVYFIKPKSFRLTKKSFWPNRAVLSTMISLGAATFVTQISIVAVSLVSNMMLARYGALSKYGPDIPISVFSIQTKVYTIVLNIVTGIVLGGQPIFGYNYGAKRLDRVRDTYRAVLRATLVTGITATVIFQLWPEAVVGIFGAGNDLYQEFAVKTFRIYLSLMTVTCLVKMTAVFFQSIGKSTYAVLSSVVRDLLCFTPLAILLPAVLEHAETSNGINGILFAAPISDLVAIVVVLVLTLSFFKSLNREIAEQERKKSAAEGAAAAETSKSLPKAQGSEAGLERGAFEQAERVECVIKPSHPGLIITIAREHGTAGKQIGLMAAQKLGIPFYYKEMTALAAQESGLDQEFLSELNNNAPNILHDLYLSTNVVQQAVIAQEKIIQKIADNGACVIVGRAADYVLRDYENVLRIFIHAPKEYRIQTVMEMYGDTAEKAAAHVKHSDDARAAYYRGISGNSWGDVHQYQLSVDASMGREQCVELICDWYRRESEKRKK